MRPGSLNHKQIDEQLQAGATLEEVAKANGLTPAQLWKRVQRRRGPNKQDRKFCTKGHELAVFGVSPTGRCRECSRIQAELRDGASKARRLAGPPRPQQKDTQKPQPYLERILDLRIRAEHAPSWEREKLLAEAQRLEDLQK